MYKIFAIIEKGVDCMYSVRSEQHFGANYFGGYGESVSIAKKDFIESVLEAFEDASSELVHVPDYKIEFRYDIPSFFADFDFINASRFAQYAGINESKMRQYKSGVAFPGEKTTRKILDAIHEIGSHSAQRLRRKIFTLFALFI